MDEKGQIQKELFEEFTAPEKKRHLKGIISSGKKRTITLSYEYLIFIAMAFIITAALFFSLGVERGKRLKGGELSLSEETTTPAAVERQKLVKEPPEEIAGELAKKLVETAAEAKEPPKKEEPVFRYTVQVASYLKRDSADQEAQRLEKKGFRSSVLSSGKFYIVCVGEFKDKAGASSEQKKLRGLYPDCYIKEKVRRR